jgi:polysaccharide biosynthesis transport protein
MEEASSGPRKFPSIPTLIHVIWLRKWLIVLVWLLVAIPAGVLLSIFDLPRTYSAHSVMRFPDVVGAQTNVMRDVAITSGQSIISILSSRQVLEGAIQKLGLCLRITSPELFHRWVFQEVKYSDGLELGHYTIVLEKKGTQATVSYIPEGSSTAYPVYQGSIREGRLSFPGMEIAFIPNFLDGRHGNKVELDFTALDETYEALRKNLSVKPLGGTNFELKVKDRDPFLVADILAALQSIFLDVYYGTTEVQDVGILVQMEKDLALAKERLEKSQDELSRYYAENPALSQPQGGQTGDNLTYLESRQSLDRLENFKRRVSMANAALDPGAAPERKFFWAMELLSEMAIAGESRASILRSSLQEIQNRQQSLRTTLGPDHPRIKETESEKENIYQQIETAQVEMVRRLNTEIEQAKARMITSAPRPNYRPPVKVQLELERLSNVNKNNQNIYDRLLETYNRAKLVTGSEFFKVSVVDPPRPAVYTPPSLKTRLLVAAAVVCLLFVLVVLGFAGFLLIFQKVFTKDDVKRLLDLKVLGSISLGKFPKPEGKSKESDGKSDVDPLLLFYGTAYKLEDLEAYRLIREEAESFFRNPRHPDRLVLLVTSTQPAEGKSLTSSNMALTFARKGKRTLLIDADLRLGRIARIFNVSASTGLDDMLNQSDLGMDEFLAAASLCLVPSVQNGLVLVPRHSNNPNAGEMVSSERFKAFIKLAREQFEVVIIDTPPMMITPEPLALVGLVDGVVFVTRSGVTPVGAAQELLEVLKERRVKTAAVLNAVRYSPFEDSRYQKYSKYYHEEAAGLNRVAKAKAESSKPKPKAKKFWQSKPDEA